MNRKVIAFAFAVILLASFPVSLSSCSKTLDKEEEKSVKNEVLSYNQVLNDDGIAVDMEDNPYFMQEMPGYSYPEPEAIEYYSGVTDTERHAMILLPENYDENKEYPVLYLLHGLGGSHRTWRNKGAHVIIRNLNYFWDVPDFITVFPNSELNAEENADDLDIHTKVSLYDKTEEDLVNYLMPYINSHYAVKPGRENTAIAGNSMGGRNTLNTAFKHQELFSYVGAFSAAYVLKSEGYHSILPPLIDNFAMDDGVDDFKLVMLCVGRSDEVCGEETYVIHDNMTQNGVEHIFYDVEGGHANKVWQNALYNFGMRLFRD